MRQENVKSPFPRAHVLGVGSRRCEIVTATMLILARLGLGNFSPTAPSMYPLVRRMPRPAPGFAKTALAPPESGREF